MNEYEISNIKTAIDINLRRNERIKILSDMIEELQTMYMYINFGREIIVNKKTYYITIVEQY